MSQHVQYMINNCPDTRLVLGGYSLGAAVTDVVLAVPISAFGFDNPLPPGADQHIAAVALFGNGSGSGSGRSRTSTRSTTTGPSSCVTAPIPICNPADPNTWQEQLAAAPRQRVHPGRHGQSGRRLRRRQALAGVIERTGAAADRSGRSSSGSRSRSPNVDGCGEHATGWEVSPDSPSGHQHDQANRALAQRHPARSLFPGWWRRAGAAAKVVADAQCGYQRGNNRKRCHEDERPSSLSREGHRPDTPRPQIAGGTVPAVHIGYGKIELRSVSASSSGGAHCHQTETFRLAFRQRGTPRCCG